MSLLPDLHTLHLRSVDWSALAASSIATTARHPSIPTKRFQGPQTPEMLHKWKQKYRADVCFT